MDAIAEIIKNFQNKHSRSLIVLATGTGKTRTACGLSDIFIRNNFVKRILFLADRKNLVTQAKGRNDAQLTYIKELIVYINKNGKFERKDLLKEELHFAGLFDNLQIVSLLTDLESLL